MKITIKNLSLLIMALLVVGLTSCGDDDPDIGDADGIPVGNGFYIASEGADPLAEHVLQPEEVEAPDFSSQAREGYVTNYVYLTSGSYNIVQVTNRAITATMGGTQDNYTDDTFAVSGCDLNSILLVTNVAEGGSAFSIPSDGLYKVMYDELRTEVVAHKIEKAGVIGGATEGGWGSDQELAIASATDSEVVFEATDVILRQGEWKLRFNCRWTISRKIDQDGELDNTNGYVVFTNIGGTLDNLVPGGSNFAIAEGEDAIYTVTATWTPDGWTVALERTGDAPEITFVPEENQWGIIGDATPTGWDADTDLNYEGVENGTYTWKLSSITLAAGGFKFRTNDSWDVNLGYDQVTITGDAGDISDDDPDNGGSNFILAAAGAGDYEITMTTSDDGSSYTVNFTKL